MIISHRYKFIFIKTMKTAGTSIEAFLSAHCGEDDILTPFGQHVAGHAARNFAGYFNPTRELWHTRGVCIDSSMKNLVARRKFYNHIPAYKVRSRVPRSVWGGYFKFCVERNPWDKTLSHYHMVRRMQQIPTFDAYLERGRFCMNYPLYTDKRSSAPLIVDRVLRYENLEEEIGETLCLLGVPFSGSLDVNAKADYRQDRRPYQEVLSGAQRRLIARTFETEIRLHGYTY